MTSVPNEQRDELFRLILGRTTTKAIERILAAGYRKPQQVTTIEELNALPVDSVVRDAKEFIYSRWHDEDGPEFDWWATLGDRREYSSKRISLPATVLHVGAGDE